MASCLPALAVHANPNSPSTSFKSFSALALPGYRPKLLHQHALWYQSVRSQNLAEQMKEMAAAEKRWQSQVRDGKVKSISPKEAGYAMQLSNYILLDVRPSTERRKAWVKNSISIPLFDVDTRIDPKVVWSKVSNFTMGGWWSGLPLMKCNNHFMVEVNEKLPKDANIILVCQKGIRSLAACEQLYNAGYKNLYWVKGGLEAAEEGDLQREGLQPFKFAGIGGVSEFLGWTDVQRAVGSKEGWSYKAVFFVRMAGIVLLVDALFLGAQQLGRNLEYFKH